MERFIKVAGAQTGPIARDESRQQVVSGLLELSFDALTTPDCLALLTRLEAETRRLAVPGHALINQLARQAGEAELGGKLSHAGLVAAPKPVGASAMRRILGRAIRLPVNRCRHGWRPPPRRSAPATSAPTMCG